MFKLIAAKYVQPGDVFMYEYENTYTVTSVSLIGGVTVRISNGKWAIECDHNDKVKVFVKQL